MGASNAAPASGRHNLARRTVDVINECILSLILQPAAREQIGRGTPT
jgi:hypothetical protein